MKKKMLSISLSLLLLAAMIPSTVTAETLHQTDDNGSSSEFREERTDNGNSESGKSEKEKKNEEEKKEEDEPTDNPVHRLSASKQNISFFTYEGTGESLTKETTVRNEGNRKITISTNKIQTNDLISFRIDGSGNLEPGGVINCIVTFDAPNARAGNYNASMLFIDASDPENGANVQVSVTATVQSADNPPAAVGNLGGEPSSAAAETPAGPAVNTAETAAIPAIDAAETTTAPAIDVAETPATRGMTILELYRLAGEPIPEKQSPFSDVKPESEYARAISWAWEKGIAKGVSDTLFNLNAPCSTESCAVFFYRYARFAGLDIAIPEGTKAPEGTHPWAAEAMAWAKGKGLTVNTITKMAESLGIQK